MNQQTTTEAPAEKPKRPNIPMAQVRSSQVAAIGYDEATQTLAVQFTRGAGAIYHYPNVGPKTAAEFINAESIGKFFGQHIKRLPFEKFDPEPAKGDELQEADPA